MMIRLAAVLLCGLVCGCAPTSPSRPEPLVLTFRGGSCSGTAIRPHVILTATHCLKGGAIAADGGVLTIRRRFDDSNDHTLLVVAQTFDGWARLALMPKMGTTIHILGNPWKLRNLYASGTVAGPYMGDTLLNLPTFPGDSGAAVLDDEDQIVGVISMVRTLTAGHVTVQWGDAKPFDFTSEQLEEANL